MWSYILRRLFFGIPTLLGVTIIVFTLLYLAPGDPISAMVPSDAPLEVVQMIRQQMGLDKTPARAVLALAHPGGARGPGELAGDPPSRAERDSRRAREYLPAGDLSGVYRLYHGGGAGHHCGLLPGAVVR